MMIIAGVGVSLVVLLLLAVVVLLFRARVGSTSLHSVPMGPILDPPLHTTEIAY